MMTWKPHPYAIEINPTNANTQKLKKTQSELTNAYLKEQTDYIQDQINKIRDSVEDTESRIAWQIENEMSIRKSTTRSKLKDTNKKDQIHYIYIYIYVLILNVKYHKHTPNIVFVRVLDD